MSAPSLGTSGAANVGYGPVRPEFAFDEARLAKWMEEHVSAFAGPLRAWQFRGGQSNPTYRLDTPARSYVLRRKPAGVSVAGAHAVEREARVLSALTAAGYPSPGVVGLCIDEAVIGSWFYIMDLVEGRIFWDVRLGELPPADRARAFGSMNATLAALHGLDVEALGLTDFGKPHDYVGRQIARWSPAYLEDPQAGRHPAMDRLVDWLPAHRPVSDEICLVHGDFRLDNMIFDPVEPRVIAVLDWELSTLGHPLVDFANHALMYHMPPDIVAGLGDVEPASLGLPTEADYIAAYCARTGRASIPHYDFYLVLNLFRLAAIFHGIRGRVIRGTAASAHARDRGESFARLAGLALARAGIDEGRSS